ncbi:MAG TPA: hypothetical protein VN150_07945 [Ochrobactrum sp.]|nr:hypothetical protein [Ochrobactrum sp.]
MIALSEYTVSATAPAFPSLVETINEYRTGSAAFKGWENHGYPNEETAIEATYGPPMRALEEWNAPLESLEDVREAVRLAFTEQAIGDEMVSEPLRAALIYLEKTTGRKDQDAERFRLLNTLESEVTFLRDLTCLIAENLLEISPSGLSVANKHHLQMAVTLAIVTRDRADDACRQMVASYEVTE